MNENFLLSLGITTITTFVLLLVAHWFPYHRFTPKLGNIARYIIGTVCMLVSPMSWATLTHFYCCEYSAWEMAIAVVCSVIAAGLAVMLGYRIDKNEPDIKTKYHNLKRDYEVLEDEIKMLKGSVL